MFKRWRALDRVLYALVVMVLVVVVPMLMVKSQDLEHFRPCVSYVNLVFSFQPLSGFMVHTTHTVKCGIRVSFLTKGNVEF